MTKHKAEQRAVRERMAKTGERYTAARHYLLDLHLAETTNGVVAPELDVKVGANPPTMMAEPAPAPAWAEHPGVSDEAIQRGTGKSWHEWFAIIDQWGGTAHGHRAIAAFVHDAFPTIDGWWAQSVTVGYERARGMRKKHQMADGFSVSASKTIAVPASLLYAALVDETRRDAWLAPGTLRVRTSQRDRSARFDVVATGTLLAVHFVAKGETKASVQLQESKLPAEDEVARRRAYWKTRLNALADVLQPSS